MWQEHLQQLVVTVLPSSTTNCSEWARHPKEGSDASRIALAMFTALSRMTRWTWLALIFQLLNIFLYTSAKYSPV